MVEAVTVRRSAEASRFGTLFFHRGSKFFETKILPLSDCASRINFPFPAKSMIPVDQGEGYPGRRRRESRFGKFESKQIGGSAVHLFVQAQLFTPSKLLRL